MREQWVFRRLGSKRRERGSWRERMALAPRRRNNPSLRDRSKSELIEATRNAY
ncbi:hypothetical protein AKJ09_06657 [Labilithrix luteola]|uniref:Uncharacterized protein n=1 Tax=Labilithrix luteola TaxID=1391654 RepID=A0A0K1Q2K1_9BACT|nr:hypothetical protein AKJ09_06657 [Labilithrix luteola]